MRILAAVLRAGLRVLRGLAPILIVLLLLLLVALARHVSSVPSAAASPTPSYCEHYCADRGGSILNHKH